MARPRKFPRLSPAPEIPEVADTPETAPEEVTEVFAPVAVVETPPEAPRQAATKPTVSIRLRATKYDIVDPTTSTRVPYGHSVPVKSISYWLQRQIDYGLVEIDHS